MKKANNDDHRLVFTTSNFYEGLTALVTASYSVGQSLKGPLWCLARAIRIEPREGASLEEVISLIEHRVGDDPRHQLYCSAQLREELRKQRAAWDCFQAERTTEGAEGDEWINYCTASGLRYGWTWCSKKNSEWEWEFFLLHPSGSFPAGSSLSAAAEAIGFTPTAIAIAAAAKRADDAIAQADDLERRYDCPRKLSLYRRLPR